MCCYCECMQRTFWMWQVQYITIFLTGSVSFSRVGLECIDGDIDIQRHCSSGSEAEPHEGSPPLTSTLTLSASFEEDILDLKWWQSHSASLVAPPQPHLRSICLLLFLLCLLEYGFFLCYLDFFTFVSVLIYTVWCRNGTTKLCTWVSLQ